MARTLSPEPRRRAMSPESFINQPTTGGRKSSSLATHCMSQGSQQRRNGSAIETWLATTMYGRASMSAGGSPSVEKCQSGDICAVDLAELAQPAAGDPRGLVTAVGEVDRSQDRDERHGRRGELGVRDGPEEPLLQVGHTSVVPADPAAVTRETTLSRGK